MKWESSCFVQFLEVLTQRFPLNSVMELYIDQLMLVINLKYCLY